MRKLMTAMVAVSCILGSCTSNTGSDMNSYGDDRAFLEAKGFEIVELKDGDARVLVAPGLQARVMTSSAAADKGISFGWINKQYIEEGTVQDFFNPYGGEERFWIGPEGGPFSYYFKKGVEQVYANWVVPKLIDTEAFELVSADCSEAVFAKSATLVNASDNSFDFDIRRTVSLLDKKALSELLGVGIPENVQSVGYKTTNVIKNAGTGAWTRETGIPSIWLLGCFTPTPTTTVFIPFNKDFEGTKVNDTYFGKVPSDRLRLEDGIAYFKIDGKFRSKIGLPSGSAKDVCGSYDSANKVLTILKYTVPEGDNVYVNGAWGPQEDPFCGDVINSYNDGPTETGYVMGPFYEVETSSPGAELQPGQSLTHVQSTIHLQGSLEELAPVAMAVFGVDIKKL